MSTDQPSRQPGGNRLDFETIGPYRVTDVLGQGGMGTVYKAIHAKTGAVVAVKVIASAMAQHQRFRRRFDAEIQTLVKLKHPAIVQLIGFGEEKGLLFYSMEYVDGENLQQLLRHEKSLPWEQVLDIAIEVCGALKHAHDFGVIHRDLKPANLMINSQGNVKLTDFGIARLFGASDSTVEGSVVGTADFMAPEQAEGKPVTVRSDLYALGSVCYAALTGRAPFQGKSIPEVLFNVRYSTYPKLADVAPHVPVEMASLIEELLERSPSKRPPTSLVVGNRFQSMKMGLKRKPPKAKPKPHEDVGKLRELTSIDLDESSSILQEIDSEDGKTISNGTKDVSSPSENKQEERPEEIQLEVDAVPAARDEVTKVASPGFASAGPHDPTVVQGEQSNQISPSITGEFPSGIGSIGNTSFTEVDDDVRTRSSVSFHTLEEKESTSHWIAIGTLAVLLLGCIGFLIYMLQGPSANRLHAEIQQAIAANDEDEWLALEDVAVRFKERFPNDPRVEDAEAVIQEAEAIRTVRQLQRKARRGNADQLEAIEQAYLECLNAQSIGVTAATQKLEAFLVMFENDESLSDRSRVYVTQAKRALEEIYASRKVNQNQASKSLKEQMDWADSHLSSSAKAKWLRAMVELFSDKPWAKELVERAKKELGE